MGKKHKTFTLTVEFDVMAEDEQAAETVLDKVLCDAGVDLAEIEEEAEYQCGGKVTAYRI